jgi:murein DD-endopeptidase MepM/ murein hydrolase activator NlpD
MLNPYEGGVFRVTSKYGYRDIGVGIERHNGLDLVGESSKKLLAICDGLVVQSNCVTDKDNLTWEWGNYVCIKANTGELIYYCHLSERLVKPWQRVKVGDVIGVEGNTGYSFGSHCHLEVRDSQNKTTPTTNIVAFTGIPNEIKKINVFGGDEMTAEEKKAFEDFRNDFKEFQNQSKEWHKVYKRWDELPTWAYNPIRAMYECGLFKGESENNLDISRDFMRMLVIQARILRRHGVIDYED